MIGLGLYSLELCRQNWLGWCYIGYYMALSKRCRRLHGGASHGSINMHSLCSGYFPVQSEIALYRTTMFASEKIMISGNFNMKTKRLRKWRVLFCSTLKLECLLEVSKNFLKRLEEKELLCLKVPKSKERHWIKNIWVDNNKSKDIMENNDIITLPETVYTSHHSHSCPLQQYFQGRSWGVALRSFFPVFHQKIATK